MTTSYEAFHEEIRPRALIDGPRRSPRQRRSGRGGRRGGVITRILQALAQHVVTGPQRTT